MHVHLAKGGVVRLEAVARSDKRAGKLGQRHAVRAASCRECIRRDREASLSAQAWHDEGAVLQVGAVPRRVARKLAFVA